MDNLPNARAESRLPRAPTSLTIRLPLAILSSTDRIYRVSGIRLYVDETTRRYRAYASLTRSADEHLEEPPTVELVGDGPDLFSAIAGLLMQMLPMGDLLYQRDPVDDCEGGIASPEAWAAEGNMEQADREARRRRGER